MQSNWSSDSSAAAGTDLEAQPSHDDIELDALEQVIFLKGD